MRHFFEWNSLPLELKNFDRDSSLAFVQDSYDNCKVLAGSESELKRKNLYIANRKFIDQLRQYQSNDFALQHIELIFNMYNCISVRILQEKGCISYIDKLIAEIPNIEIQTKIALEFKTLVDM